MTIGRRSDRPICCDTSHWRGAKDSTRGRVRSPDRSNGPDASGAIDPMQALPNC